MSYTYSIDSITCLRCQELDRLRAENEELRRRIDSLLRPRARRSDPDTSHDAADALDKPLAMNAKRSAVLRVLSACGPMVDASLISAYERQACLGHLPQQTAQSIRSRRAELVRMGLVAAGGKRKVGRHLHTIWRARP